ncbi:30S ribosomal protein S3, chloroplastic-like [Tripterygium wilfordii]|uniref:30S ribosomal protein S3, chloroplastic-like n=1 Tax=Tripterygium wilfordii TaxID=458696 RepID=UPI0018F84358|nr:30S ribosomal protein S3, chloroplastic-like [Tripterygium wilfordii]
MVKNELERLLKVGFIKTERYAGELSSPSWMNIQATTRSLQRQKIHPKLHSDVQMPLELLSGFKYPSYREHHADLRRALTIMRKYGLKINPLKYAFKVSTRNFLGFMVHQKGIDVDENKARVALETQPLSNKKELQRFLGQINFLKRFISNFAEKVQRYSNMEKTKLFQAPAEPEVPLVSKRGGRVSHISFDGQRISSQTIKNRVSCRKAMKKAIELAEQMNTKGIQVQIVGRINGKEIARVDWIREGRVPLQTIRAKIDYCSYTVQTLYGVLGIKIWIFGDEE